MMYIIHCEQCEKECLFEINLTFTYWQDTCDSCRHSQYHEWKYWFCNLDCLAKWTKENEEGFPCQNCRHTGFNFGFEQNGTCQICKGTKRVKSKVFNPFKK